MDSTTLEENSVKVGAAALFLGGLRWLGGWNSSREQRLRDLEKSREVEREAMVALQNEWASERLKFDDERLLLRTKLAELKTELHSAMVKVSELTVECSNLRTAVSAANKAASKAAKPKPRAKPKPKPVEPQKA